MKRTKIEERLLKNKIQTKILKGLKLREEIVKLYDNCMIHSSKNSTPAFSVILNSIVILID